MSPQGPAFILVPRPDYEVLHDTWHVSGMRGTGSKDIVVEDAFVPPHRLLPLSKLGPGLRHGRAPPARQLPLAGMSMLSYTLCSPLVGLAQAAVDDFIERLAGTTGPGRTARVGGHSDPPRRVVR